MTTYIILGSNSFSGTVFIKNLLNRGHRVIALSRSSKKKKFLIQTTLIKIIISINLTLTKI